MTFVAYVLTTTDRIIASVSLHNCDMEAFSGGLVICLFVVVLKTSRNSPQISRCRKIFSEVSVQEKTRTKKK